MLAHPSCHPRIARRITATIFALFSGLFALSPDFAAGQARNIDKAEVDALNRELRNPALLFASKPQVSVDGFIVNLVALNRNNIIVESLDRKNRRTVANKAVKSFIVSDSKFRYTPAEEDLLDLVTRMRDIPGVIDRYHLVANDDEVEDILFDDSPTTTAAPTAVAQLNTVPEPAYAVDEPWNQVALLNAPAPPPRPARPTPVEPPPAVAPAPAPAGFPDWGKYAIAAIGVAGIIVFLKK